MKDVNASIITIGDELLIGQTIDTNSAFIARELNNIGIWVKSRIAVGDDKREIIDALNLFSRNNDLVIITGGLGPTADDITKPVLCEYFNSKLIVNDSALRNVKDIFTRLKRPIIESNLKQAEVPDNCIVLPNSRGTAPGMWFEKQNTIYVSLPGVPDEMKALILKSVIPKLKEQLVLPVIIHRTLLIAGKGESEIAEMIKEFESKLPGNIKLAYLPFYGTVRLRLTGRSSDRSIMEKLITERFEELKTLVKEYIVADHDSSMADALSEVLKQKGKTVCTAESCTGGYIAHLITSRPGSSSIYFGSVVAYDNSIKENILGVDHNTLNRVGAVSEETVTEMIKGALNHFKTDYAIATSGIMGPDGGSVEKPVGTVWIAVGNNSRIKTNRYHFRFDRIRNIEQTTQMAMLALFKFIVEDS
jgi:nicotinamide-nucleotide amidase